MSLSPGQHRVIRFFEHLPLVAGVFVMLFAVAVLAEWASGVPEPLIPGGAVMLPLTAVLFLTTGASLAFMARSDVAAQPGVATSDAVVPTGARALRWVAAALAVLAILVALLQAGSWAAGRNLGLDLLLFPDTVGRGPARPPGRMAINTVAGFVFAGAALVALHADDYDRGRSAQWFALVTTIIAFIALIGHAFGVPRLYAPLAGNAMALSTAVCFCGLGLGTIFARHDAGLPALMVDPGSAGSVTRRLVPAAVLVPFLLGWARTAGERAQFFDDAFGIAVYIVATVGAFLWVVSWSARLARVNDATRQQLFERERAARAAAEDANVSKSNFLAVMSHELRTPLSAIMGYEELLVDEITGPVNEAQRHQLGRIKASAQHLLHLIDQILTFSRIDAGREVVHLEDVTADEMAHDAAALVEPLARERGLTFSIVPLGYAVPMRTDGGKVRQILVNLLSNAVKFTTAGSVTLSVRHDGGTVRYVVRDTGIGIAPEHLDRIFDAFWQVEQPSTRRAGGTGLGLSVTRRLAHLLGGDVSVESVPGAGSTFTVTLPVELSDRTSEAATPPTAAGPAVGRAPGAPATAA